MTQGSDTPTEKRQCQGISKKTGERCTALAAKGGALCAGHAGLGKLDARKAAARSAEIRAAKAEERSKTLKDRLAEGLEQRADKILAAFDRALEQPDGYKAAETWLTRVYGRPTEHVQTEDVTSRPEEMGMGELLRELRKHAQATN